MTRSTAWSSPIEVPSSDPADLQRATQAIADALASTVAAAPDQWYSFKPIWPSTPRRRPTSNAGPASCWTASRTRARTGVQLTVRRLGPRLRGRAIRSASWLACHLPEAPLVGLAELAGDAGIAPRRSARRRPGATSPGWSPGSMPRSRVRRSPGAPPMTPVPWSVSSGLPTGTRHAITSRSRGRRPSRRRAAEAPRGRDARDRRGRLQAGATSDLRRPALRCDRAAGPLPGVAGR